MIPPAALQELDFLGTGLENRPYDGARMFPLLSASHSFDLESCGVVE